MIVLPNYNKPLTLFLFVWWNWSPSFRLLLTRAGSWWRILHRGLPWDTILLAGIVKLSLGPLTFRPSSCPLHLDCRQSSLGSVVRAKRAFACGFYARCALETCTSYTGASTNLPIADTVWVVLRAGNSFSYRVSTKSDLNRLLAIRGQYSPIYQGFPSATEVQIFCAGCNIEVPPLFKWKKP